jgi:hypothetical protein
LKPWRVKSWVIPSSSDDQARAAFVCQMEQVLDVYARPYDSARPVVCLDETRKQLVNEKRQPFTDSQGTVHVDYEYKREGVATIYMLCEPLGGYREVFITGSQDRLNWARVVGHLVEKVYPEAERITLVQDNLSAHKVKALYEVYRPERARRIARKLEIVWTPVHGSWLNIAEIELAVLARQCLSARIADVPTLEKQVGAWETTRNQMQKGVDWQFTTADARIKLKRLYPSIIT